ncbi:SDR family oxidoreductase [Mesorhizobium sp. YIM 152430]|jgi:2-keto-3-deoxy-L-fuconate dehydrogenase|uniref:SDR family oxidoreductase n=1 Tax=Mesorhizobium sp. YIM 152430 TaxID=3031761 RepID=UPI0023DC44F8|nr:SDR family oxidoreductase [Mesorhizobium sp. YIM 152430]MDF1600837.1 SDR family oxidoreductase [Mesorhizobium sp. YIM 152430]
MMIDLTGRTALVTAAAQGIGHASAIALARAGATVVATDINSEGLTAFQGVRGITARPLDVLDPTAISSLVGELGRIDILFNCAGIVHAGTVLDCTDDEFDFAFALNVKAQIRMIKAVLPGMLERRDGCIINMASVASSVKGVPNRCLYSASKAAVIGLTKSVAADYVAQGIRCNAICPGTVDSPSLHERLRAQGDYEAARSAFIARQPIGRIGTAEEIADLVVYLSAASYTTGAIHLIDGGWAI